jgi:serine/threonine-protein kinase RsbW
MSTVAAPLDLSLRAVPPSIREAREAAAEAARKLDLSNMIVNNVRLCVSEAVTNVVRHAYVGEAGDVRITAERLEPGIRVVVRDSGSGTTTVHERDRREVGGLGWKIVRALADRVTVTSSSERGTEVTMSFGTRADGRSPRFVG